MAATKESLIPARFMASAAHFVGTCMVYYAMDDNVDASIAASGAGRAKAEASLLVAWSIALLCHAVDFVGIFAGFTLFFTRVNFIQTLCHTVGAVLVFLFVFSAWHYLAFWYIVIFCNMLPSLVEASVWVAIFGCKTIDY